MRAEKAGGQRDCAPNEHMHGRDGREQGRLRDDKLVAARPLFHVCNAWTLEGIALVDGCRRQALFQRLGLLGLGFRCRRA